VDLSSAIKRVKDHHKDHKAFNNKNWQRINLMPKLIKGASILDIGIGNGACLNLLHLLNKYQRICGIDLKKHTTQNLLSEEIEYQEMNITNLRFEDNEFDTIICMEVLEHLGSKQDSVEAQNFLGWNLDSFYKGIIELRRVAKRRIIVSVPFNESFPIYHHNIATGHKQIFDKKKLSILFPNATFYKFHHWVFIVEDNPKENKIEIMKGSEL